jgi:Taurine catabolism dioxygenase TauD, TfdA family
MSERTRWRGDDLAGDESWLWTLAPSERREIGEAVGRIERLGRGLAEIREADFPLSAFRDTLDRARRELEHGRGFVVLRGFDVGRGLDSLKALTVGLGRHLGDVLVQQNGIGGLVDVVADRGDDYANVHVKGYETRAALSPHCDSGDVVGLLCVRKAKSGGQNSIASFETIYREIAATRPELLEPLRRGFHYNIRGGGPPGPWQHVTRHRVPVFVLQDGRVSGRFNGRAIRTAPEVGGVPALTALELEAVERVERLAVREDLRLDMTLEPGDLQLLYNHRIIHTRTAFEDHDEPERKRLLLRLWVNLRDAPALPDDFTDHYNTGPRRGPYALTEGPHP